MVIALVSVVVDQVHGLAVLETEHRAGGHPRSPDMSRTSWRGEALTLSDNDRFMLNDLLDEHDALEARIAAYTAKIDEQMTPWEEQLRLLTTRHRPHRRPS
ncbi:MAG: hypothetical protein OXE76_10055 [Alphaproteobacteria bacterium]|nr:hypothetical protein [Alphaproteobacteria bacterium]